MGEADKIWKAGRCERAAQLGADRFNGYCHPASQLGFNVTDTLKANFPLLDGSLWRNGELAQAAGMQFFLGVGRFFL